MQGKMKAQMFYAPGDVRFEETDIPQIKDDEVLVQVKAALTCGTDLKIYRRGHPTIMTSVPSTFGHEFSGVVVEAGKDVTKFKVGDRIVGANTAPCFECEHCKNKRYSLCENLQYLNGAYSEYVAVPAHILKYNFYRVPDHLPFEQAALLEPLACAVHGKRPDTGQGGRHRRSHRSRTHRTYVYEAVKPERMQSRWPRMICQITAWSSLRNSGYGKLSMPLGKNI